MTHFIDYGVETGWNSRVWAICRLVCQFEGKNSMSKWLSSTLSACGLLSMRSRVQFSLEQRIRLWGYSLKLIQYQDGHLDRFDLSLITITQLIKWIQHSKVTAQPSSSFNKINPQQNANHAIIDWHNFRHDKWPVFLYQKESTLTWWSFAILMALPL